MASRPPPPPRETCFRRAQQVILVPVSLGYDLIFQEPQPPPPQTSQKPSWPGQGERERGPRGFSHSRKGQARPGHLDSWEGIKSRCWGHGSQSVAVSLGDSPSASPGVLVHLAERPSAPWSPALLAVPHGKRQRNCSLRWGKPLMLWAGNPSPEMGVMGNKGGPHLGF